jgi:ABC-type lipoprotein export system ATPase subunit
MMTGFERGAEWRIWDFQVHTPFSELNNGFGDDLEAYAAEFFSRAIKRQVAVVGVTDYFSIEGFRYLRALQADADKLSSLIGAHQVSAAQNILLLPNVELRSDVLVDGNRVNYHVIFSNEISDDDIEENFLHQLQFTAEGDPQSPDQRHPLTKRNLEDLGTRLKAVHANFSSLRPLFVGMTQAAVSHQEVVDVLLRQQQRFGKRYVFCVPCDEDLSSLSWDSQAHLTRKILLRKSDLFFSSNKNTRAFALGEKHDSPDGYLQEFGAFKPCVHGSDAHKNEELFLPAKDRFTWIKADPTFLGLRQVLNEPKDRVFIGSQPPLLSDIRTRATKVVRSMAVKKKGVSSLAEKWFDNELQLNPELVAIIGNKGSGKSALADVLGLLGNTPRHQSFSFLSPERFNDRKNNKAKHFEASVIWQDGKSEGPISLDQSPRPEALETIKYIPQDYLETICNEVTLGSGSQFYDELQKVIFSHVSEPEKLGFPTLDLLLEHRSAETRKTIGLLYSELQGINRQLVGAEDQLTDSYRKSLEAQLAGKRRELDAIEKPKERPVPAEDPKTVLAAAGVTEQITTLRESLTKLDTETANAKQRLAADTRRRTAAERLMVKLANIEKQLNASLQDASADAQELGLDLTQVVRLEIDSTQISAALQQAIAAIASTASILDEKTPTGLVARHKEISAEVATLNQSLSEPQRKYEAYLAAVRKWEADRIQVLGSAEQPGSLRHIEHLINQIPTARARRGELVAAQLEKSLQIYREKERLRDDFMMYYGAVQSFLTTHPLAQSQQFKLTFNVSITQQGFTQAFLKLLNQRRVGTFSGLDEGTRRLSDLVDATSFESIVDVQAFMNRVIQSLRRDERAGKNGATVDVQDQLAQGTSAADVYDYVYGLEYLEPIYKLRWDGKSIEQLSPGERGNLLLIFYLLIDRDNIPLVIDQPEENLDNNTVYRTLVPCIKEAKKRRQIVMVTHNPNLAVVCDAEQVICAEMFKDRANEIRYVAGSIENPLINQKIIDILEGTRPAFDKRDAKYWN